MKLIYLIPVIILAILFLIISLKRHQTDKLTAIELEYLRHKYIVEHKDQFPKIDIQKAQQGIDAYLGKKKNSSKNKKRSLTDAPFIK